MLNRNDDRMFDLLTVAALALLFGAGCEGMGLGLDGDDDDDMGAESAGDYGGDADADADADGDDDDPDEQDTDEQDTDDCDLETPVTLYLSADDSNSMAQPVVARQQIENGSIFYGAVRPYEFLNYYSFNYQAAEPGTVNVSAQMRANEDDSFNLQIGVRSEDQHVSERRPMNITLSLDTSGSMSGAPIEMVRASCLALAGSLRAGDVVSLVTWDTSQSIILESHPVVGPADPVLTIACADLESGGGTDLHSGLVTAYELASDNYAAGRINRVILMSDGGANVGVTDEDMIAQHADDAEGEAIYMMGVGMSSYGYNDELMDTVTDAGKGAYLYIDSAAEAERMFGARFLDNVEIAARDVRVELTMPPGFEMIDFHGEEYSEDPEEVEPQHLAPNDAMIFHQVVGSCDPASVDLGAPVTITATYKDPFTREPGSDTLETTLDELLAGGNAQLLKGDAIVAYAQALAAVQGLSGTEAVTVIDAAIAKVDTASAALAGDPDLEEISELLTTYRGTFQ